MSKNKVLVILTAIMLVGGFLRFYSNTVNPPSLNIDEVAIGYDAYSILKTGRDQYGRFLPLSFESVGDYKPPVLIYLTAPAIAIFGLNEFSVRFPVALFSVIGIFAFFYLSKRIFRDDKKALVASLILAISPWHIYFSRYGAEAIVALTFLIAGVYFLFRIFEDRWYVSVLSSLLLALSMYTYHAERLFVPLLVLGYLVIFRDKVLKHRKHTTVFLVLVTAFLVPLIISTLFGPDSTRAKSTFIANDIEYIRNVVVDSSDSGLLSKVFGNEAVLLLFYWARKYLNYLRPSFLFYNGLDMTTDGTYGLGVLYLFEIFFFILGAYKLIKSRSKESKFIIVWILLAILPATLAQSEQHALRSLVALPAVLIVVVVGLFGVYEYLKKKFTGRQMIITYLVFSVIVLWSISHALLVFGTYFPRQKGEDFMDGTKEAVEYAIEHNSEYEEIVLDPYRGVDSPYIVSVPHMYVLFYSQYEPSIYQAEEKRVGIELYGFDKYTIRKINWPEEKGKTDTLFIGSPWSIPEKDLNEGELLKKVYMTDNNLVFIIASPE